MNLKEHLSLVLEVAGIRRDQWAALANAKENSLPDWSPDDTISELWEVWGAMSEDSEHNEAQNLTDTITQSINYVQAYEIDGLTTYGFIGDDMPTCPT